jgi:hypothetical protein
MHEEFDDDWDDADDWEDNSADSALRWGLGCLCAVGLTGILMLGVNHAYDSEVEVAAIKAGLVQTIVDGKVIWTQPDWKVDGKESPEK